MNISLEDRIRRILNETLLRRVLTEYFKKKGIKFENFDRNVYPPMIQDMMDRIPQLMGKIEVEPHVENINPYTGKVDVGWNLFALGTQRMDLGRSTHKSHAELRRSLAGPVTKEAVTKKASPNSIIEFIVNVLGDTEDGIIDPKDDQAAMPGGQPGQQGPGSSAKFYAGSQGFEQNRPVN